MGPGRIHLVAQLAHPSSGPLDHIGDRGRVTCKAEVIPGQKSFIKTCQRKRSLDAELCGIGEEVLHTFEVTGRALRRDEIGNWEKPDAV